MPGVRVVGIAAACSAYGRPAVRSSASRASVVASAAASAAWTRTNELFCTSSAAISNATSTSPPRPVRSRRSKAAAMPKARVMAHM